MKNSEITCMIYRYEALLQAIDFLTQRFAEDHIIGFAFDFSNEILTLHSSALFLREGSDYVLKSKKNYHFSTYTIKGSEKIHNIARFHGHVIYENFSNFFEHKDIFVFEMALIIPLIADDQVLGFIVSDGKNMGGIDACDLKISEALLSLFRNSLENSRTFAELKDKNKVLDEKVFNLFAINQSVKSMLSEIELEKLYHLGIDIFSELTGSKVTSFGIYDERTNTIKMEAYKNSVTYDKYYTEFSLHTRCPLFDGTVFHVKRDETILRSIFCNYEELFSLEAEYVILIKRDELLGVVTVGSSMFEEAYKASTFELIETLASFTYIALSNAIQFNKIIKQKEIIRKNFNSLSNLNKVIRTINQSENMDDLFHLTLETLHISFGIQKAFVALKENDYYKIINSLGISLSESLLLLNSNWEESQKGHIIYDFKADSITNYFDKKHLKELGSANCLVIAPIYKESFCMEDKVNILGYLVVTETLESLKNEEILIIDTIARNISPVLFHMQKTEEIKKEFIIDIRKKFLTDLEKKIYESKLYNIDFYIYYKNIFVNPFKEIQEHFYYGDDYYKINNFLFVLSYEESNNAELKKLPSPDSLDDFFDTMELLHKNGGRI